MAHQITVLEGLRLQIIQFGAGAHHRIAAWPDPSRMRVFTYGSVRHPGQGRFRGLIRPQNPASLRVLRHPRQKTHRCLQALQARRYQNQARPCKLRSLFRRHTVPCASARSCRLLAAVYFCPPAAIRPAQPMGSYSLPPKDGLQSPGQSIKNDQRACLVQRVRDAIRLLEKNGWMLDRIRDNHPPLLRVPLH